MKIVEVADRQNFVAWASEKSLIAKTLVNSPAQDKSGNSVSITRVEISHLSQTDSNTIEFVKIPIGDHNSAGSIQSEMRQPEKSKISYAASLLPIKSNQTDREASSEGVEQKLSTQLALHNRETNESRIKDFDSIHENAEKYANLVAHQQKERNNALSINAVSEIWTKQYKESYGMQWESNRDSRVTRRECEIREAIAISAKFHAISQYENKKILIENKTNTEIGEKASVDEKVAFLMQNVRQANEEWMRAKDFQTAALLSPQTERVMQFYIERDNTTAPERETVETANFIADANGINQPHFTSELDAKVWVMKNLPDTGKQLFLENYIEQIQSNASQMLVEMQTIQLNESMQIIRQQSEKLNQEINQPPLNQSELNKMWQNLQQAIDKPVDSQTIEIIRQFQSDSKKSEIINPISELDAIHTTLTKANDSVSKTNTNEWLETIHREVQQDEVKAKAELEAQSVELEASKTRVFKLD